MRRTNLIIFFIAVIVFAGTFLLSLVSLPSADRDVDSSRSDLSAESDRNASHFKVPKSGIHTFMGKSKADILKTFGDPERIDESKYGYQWLIYGRGTENYVQIGIDKTTEKVTTIYALGKNLKTDPFKIGQDSRQIYQKVPISDTASFTYKGTKIEFEFNEEDLMIRPLVKFGDQWVQLNFDHIDDQLIGVRYLSPEVLVRQHPYTMIYEGELPEFREPTDSEWAAINKGEDRQILDITNVLRVRSGEKTLAWNEAAHQAAYKHSHEMQKKNYFSHDSRWSGDLKTRLENEQLTLQGFGENIAARYPDSAAVTVGWLNSAGHRKNLLNDTFTELGVGSFKNYYTQDFIRPADR